MRRASPWYFTTGSRHDCNGRGQQRDRVPYDESRYLITLQKRGAPLHKHGTQSP
jgi:hypothetical protein